MMQVIVAGLMALQVGVLDVGAAKAARPDALRAAHAESVAAVDARRAREAARGHARAMDMAVRRMQTALRDADDDVARVAAEVRMRRRKVQEGFAPSVTVRGFITRLNRLAAAKTKQAAIQNARSRLRRDLRRAGGRAVRAARAYRRADEEYRKAARAWAAVYRPAFRDAYVGYADQKHALFWVTQTAPPLFPLEMPALDPAQWQTLYRISWKWQERDWDAITETAAGSVVAPHRGWRSPINRSGLLLIRREPLPEDCEVRLRLQYQEMPDRISWKAKERRWDAQVGTRRPDGTPLATASLPRGRWLDVRLILEGGKLSAFIDDEAVAVQGPGGQPGHLTFHVLNPERVIVESCRIVDLTTD